MTYKWMLLMAAIMAATPAYLLWQGDALGAAIIGIPIFLIGAVLAPLARGLI